jgi:hypothetical protein
LTDGIVDSSGTNVSVEQERDKIRKVHTRLRDEEGERRRKHTEVDLGLDAVGADNVGRQGRWGSGFDNATLKDGEA